MADQAPPPLLLPPERPRERRRRRKLRAVLRAAKGTARWLKAHPGARKLLRQLLATKVKELR